ncbi:MAG TPA: alpha/beta hydrolase [Chloroflexota bacterium]|jgi:pimeloyl-ACP methyl ester carboxylesterase
MPLTKEATDRTATIDGIQIHYNEAGSGPALICTHGGGPGANAWDNTRHSFDALAEHFRVILLDMPGFGESQKLVSRNGVPMDFFCAKLQLGLMDQLGIDRAHLYGSSAFSATAIRFGIEYPDRVGKIVVQAWSPVHGPQTDGLKSLGIYANNPTRENMVKMCEYFIPRPELRPDAFIDARFRAAQIPGHLESRREFSGQASSDVTPDLPKLKTDVLITWGEADGVIAIEGLLDALRLIPNSRAYVWGDRSGHFVCYEHPEEFARVVTAFLTS